METAEKALSTAPSKWDIIPIHTSDRATFKFCRRQWKWSSPSQFNLVPRASVHGISEPLWFGTGIHYALQKMYNPTLPEDPVTVWLAWFDLQWNGGLVTADEVGEFADREPELVGYEPNLDQTPEGVEMDKGGVILYKVKGLRDILPFVDEGRFEELRDLGRGMMEFYKDYAERNDDFEVVALEHLFSVPILSPQGEPLYMVDRRQMPEDWVPNFDLENKYGPLMREIQDATDPLYKHGYMKQVHARGRIDKIIRQLSTGRYGVWDYKTTNTLDEDYFRHLELDEQSTTYLWAGEIEADLLDLPWKKLEFVTYEAILKGYPKPPTIKNNGMPSINRKEETTTAKMFEDCVNRLGIVDLIKADEKSMKYYQWLLEIGDKRYIDRTDTWRNKIQKENAGIRIYYEALDMLNPNLKAYPNPTKNYGCLNCRFRGPCIAAEDGSDVTRMIEEGYISNWDR